MGRAGERKRHTHGWNTGSQAGTHTVRRGTLSVRLAAKQARTCVRVRACTHGAGVALTLGDGVGGIVAGV